MRSPDCLKMKKINMKKFFDSQFKEHIDVANKTKDEVYDSFKKAVNICVKAIKNKKKILFFGNGGSAADAQHLATELTVRFSKNRAAISAIALTTDSSAITAIGNDFGFKYLFARQIEALGNAGDVVVGISTSGKSENVILGLKVAKERKLKTIAFTGRYTNKLKFYSNEIISVPAKNTSRIQEMHITLGQMLCNAIEAELNLTGFVEIEKFN